MILILVRTLIFAILLVYTRSTMYIAILGRQPAFGIAELERLYGAQNVTWFSAMTAVVDNDGFDFERLGGSQKAGRVMIETRGTWRHVGTKIIQDYCQKWHHTEHKITLGISVYGFDVSAREVQKTGLILKSKLKSTGVSLRLVPNSDSALNTAVSHHNKLGLSSSKVELLIVRASNGAVVIAESVGAQNITALAARDQARPRTDAFVGMLPPKLARMMVNLAVGDRPARGRLLDPFCGTGVVLQEAGLMGHAVYGTDLSEKMIRYSRDNINWLQTTKHVRFDWYLHEGDAMTTMWQQPIELVVGETYLGQPFSAPPSPAKLTEVRNNCDRIITSFLTNLAPQIAVNTPLCLAVPAWRDHDGHVTHLPLINSLGTLGYKVIGFKNIRPEDLLYYRPDQIVARELLVLEKHLAANERRTE